MTGALELTREYVEGVLTALGVAATIAEEEIGGEKALQVDTTDQALLIGRGGENLKALQYLIHQMVARQLPDSPMITIDVAGYRKQRLRKLDVMVGLAKTQALSSNEPVELAPMNAYERRYIHSILTNEPELTSESLGQEPARHIVIRKAN